MILNFNFANNIFLLVSPIFHVAIFFKKCYDLETTNSSRLIVIKITNLINQSSIQLTIVNLNEKKDMKDIKILNKRSGNIKQYNILTIY